MSQKNVEAGKIKRDKLLAIDPDYYKKMGALGGAKGHGGGFAYMKAHGQLDKVRELGRKGGALGKRTK